MTLGECFVGQRVAFTGHDGVKYTGIVSSINLKQGMVDMDIMGRGLAWIEPARLVDRDAKTYEPMGPDLGHFPHTCPKCGGRAYVGLARIEHPGEQGQGECP